MAVVVAVLLLVGLLTPLPAAAGQSLAHFCGDTGNYTADGTYQSNLTLVAATLPNKTTSTPELFAAATSGLAPDAVFALALCRGDLVGNATSCGDCIAASFQQAQQRCPFNKGAIIYNDDCLLRFSNASILISDDIADNTTLFDAWNPQSIGGGGDASAFAADVHELLAQTTWLAGTTGRRFTTGVMNDGGGSAATPTLYSLAQCTPELTAGDCLQCLQRLVGMVNSTTGARMGGRILTVRCNIRFETFKFYNGAPLQRILPPGAPPPAPAPAKRDVSRREAQVIAAVVAPLAAIALCVIFCCRFWRARKKGNKGQLIQHEGLRGDEQVWVMEPELSEFSIFDFREVLEATNNFSEENKLGEGGFGPVYKGQFGDGLEIAVKRLASHSGQGFVEFRNEVQLIAKLQHTNLVRLLGCCFQGEENILVYEYLSNKSLDFFIFDENRKALLDWNKRLAIIEGIAQGLLYLHKHSRLRVIHRDLKPSNILLDNDMSPKISDFGLAKIFSSNSNGETTRRVVGTYGYMAPEYASEGHFSMKSDVFSFGVLTLEILSGKRNSDFNQCGDFINYIGYAWKLWEEERWTELIDDSLVPESESLGMMRCINIALLCVQENAVDRPTMSDVVAMLSSESIALVEPKHPAYFHVRVTNLDASVVTETYSMNDLTMYEKPKY